jgi:predicted DCC family thiol-disulfide oxidoreductase YuxK
MVMSSLPPSDYPIVFFDGVCGLCNASVDRLLRWDRRAVLRFAPLQGSTAAAMLPPHMVRDLDSLVLLDAQGPHLRSDAALLALKYVGGPWRLLSALRVVPRPLRDGVYGLIARRRYQWFGRKESCRLPGPQEREPFLP